MSLALFNIVSCLLGKKPLISIYWEQHITTFSSYQGEGKTCMGSPAGLLCQTGQCHSICLKYSSASISTAVNMGSTYPGSYSADSANSTLISHHGPESSTTVIHRGRTPQPCGFMVIQKEESTKKQKAIKSRGCRVLPLRMFREGIVGAF